MRNIRNNLAQGIMVSITKYGKIKRSDLNDEKLSKTLIEDLIREMVDSSYITLDFDEDNEMALKGVSEISVPRIINKDSTVILRSSTNSHMKKYIHRDGKIIFKDNLLYFIGRYDEIIFCTSLLIKYEINDDVVVFHTLNSEYTFKLIKEIKIDDSILAQQEEIDRVMKLPPLTIFI